MDLSHHSTTRTLLLAVGLLLVPPFLNSATARGNRLFTEKITVTEARDCITIEGTENDRRMGDWFLSYESTCEDPKGDVTEHGPDHYFIEAVDCTPEICGEGRTPAFDDMPVTHGDIGIEKSELKPRETVEGTLLVHLHDETIARVEFTAKWKQPLLKQGCCSLGGVGPVVVGPM